MRLRALLSTLIFAGAASLSAHSTTPSVEHWQLDVSPMWFHKSAEGTFEDAISKEHQKISGSMWGVRGKLETLQPNNWYGSLHGYWASGRLDSKVNDTAATTKGRGRNTDWEVMLRVGYHYDMGHNMLDSCITPFVGIGYEGWKAKLPLVQQGSSLVASTDITAGVFEVGFIGSYVIDQNWSVGLETAIGANFSTKQKDFTDNNRKTDLKNKVRWKFDVPIGYALHDKKMAMVEKISLVPFYHFKDYGRSKEGVSVYPKMKNKNYGLRLDLGMYF